MPLFNGDLKGTIADLISIDEFEPKTGTKEELIVVAFYAIDEMPAKDMDSYLERSHLSFIDVEVSPNPNEDGYYLVFVEMKRNNEFVASFHSMVKDVTRLTGKMEWKISPYLSDNLYNLDDPRWEKFVITDDKSYKSKEEFSTKVAKQAQNESLKQELKEYFKNSTLTVFEQRGNRIKVGDAHGSIIMSIKDFCTEAALVEKCDFVTKPILWESSSPTLKLLTHALGSGWNVFQHEGDTFISNSWDDRVLRAK